jgi:hypothetical protein
VFDSLLEAATGFSTYFAALQAGYVALVALSDDLNTGPLDDRSDD